jgi:predicted  nucleic acid-binding Zn-ribbon protein
MNNCPRCGSEEIINGKCYECGWSKHVLKVRSNHPSDFPAGGVRQTNVEQSDSVTELLSEVRGPDDSQNRS